MVQRSGIDTIKYHTWPRIPMGKWQTHRRHHKREPRGQPFPSRWPQSTYKQTRTKQSKHKTEQKHKRSTKVVPPWKTCLKQSLKKKTRMVFKTDYHLMQVKSIAECSKGSILQYFWLSLSYHLSLRSLFYLFLSGRLRQVLLIQNIPDFHVSYECSRTKLQL